MFTLPQFALMAYDQPWMHAAAAPDDPNQAPQVPVQAPPAPTPAPANGMSPFQQALLGAVQQANQQTLPDFAPQDKRQAAFDVMGNVGMQLLAASQRMTGPERARILAGAGDALGSYGSRVLSSAQARLMNAQYEAATRKQNVQQALQQQLMTMPGLSDSERAYALANPEAFLAAQYQTENSKNKYKQEYDALIAAGATPDQARAKLFGSRYSSAGGVIYDQWTGEPKYDPWNQMGQGAVGGEGGAAGAATKTPEDLISPAQQQRANSVVPLDPSRAYSWAGWASQTIPKVQSVVGGVVGGPYADDQKTASYMKQLTNRLRNVMATTWDGRQTNYTRQMVEAVTPGSLTTGPDAARGFFDTAANDVQNEITSAQQGLQVAVQARDKVRYQKALQKLNDLIPLYAELRATRQNFESPGSAAAPPAAGQPGAVNPAGTPAAQSANTQRLLDAARQINGN